MQSRILFAGPEDINNLVPEFWGIPPQLAPYDLYVIFYAGMQIHSDPEQFLATSSWLCLRNFFTPVYVDFPMAETPFLASLLSPKPPPLILTEVPSLVHKHLHEALVITPSQMPFWGWSSKSGHPPVATKYLSCTDPNTCSQTAVRPAVQAWNDK